MAPFLDRASSQTGTIRSAFYFADLTLLACLMASPCFWQPNPATLSVGTKDVSQSTPQREGAWIPGFGQHGWFRIPNTRMDKACPPNNYNGTDYPWADRCENVMYAWSGGVEDVLRHRMLIWGGGHNDYPGNEIYSLNLSRDPIDVTRLTNPTTATQPGARGPANLGGPCIAILNDGSANSAHTYNSLIYDPANDRMVAFPDGVTCQTGGIVPRIVFYQIATNSWRLQGLGGIDSDFNNLAAVEPTTGHYWIHTSHNFYDYDPVRNQLTSKLSFSADSHVGGAYDPVRRIFLVLGPGTFYSINTRNFSRTNLTMSSSCSAIASPAYPSVVWDSDRDLFAIYNNAGDTVYEYDPRTHSCTARTINVNPCGNPGSESKGTFGRWQYEAEYKLYVLWNDPHQDACVWRP